MRPEPTLLGLILTAKSKGVESMILWRKMITSVALIVFVSVFLLEGGVFASDQTLDPELQREWRDWCYGVKDELGALRVFDAKAQYVSALPNSGGVRFIEFESLRIPYIVDEIPSISVKRGLEGGPWLRISYESGLRILATSMMRNPVPNVFDNLVPELTPGIKAYIIENYTSLENFTTQVFGGSPDFVHLGFEGYRFTTEDIDCSGRIEDTLRLIPALLASGSADYKAVLAGEDVAYWSSNRVPGVVTRQEVAVSRGSLGPRILWSGEFIDDDEIWQVIISFGVENQGRYDRLGRLLANPGLE